MPSKASFITFLRHAGINSTVLPDADTDIDDAYNWALEVVNDQIANISSKAYDKAVYNLGTHTILRDADDQTGQTFFVDQRKKWNLNALTSGLVASTGDEGTNTSLAVPKFTENMTYSDLSYVKTPFGLAYLEIAQKFGGQMGLT